MLRTRFGDVDWAALPLIAAHLGVQDLDQLIESLRQIRSFDPNADPSNQK